MARRIKLEIMTEILSLCRQPQTKTRVMYQTNARARALRATGLSMRRIQEKVHRSLDTIGRHIKAHNEGVLGGRGYCVKCRRVKSGMAGLDVD